MPGFTLNRVIRWALSVKVAQKQDHTGAWHCSGWWKVSGLIELTGQRLDAAEPGWTSGAAPAASGSISRTVWQPEPAHVAGGRY